MFFFMLYVCVQMLYYAWRPEVIQDSPRLSPLKGGKGLLPLAVIVRSSSDAAPEIRCKVLSFLSFESVAHSSPSSFNKFSASSAEMRLVSLTRTIFPEGLSSSPMRSTMNRSETAAKPIMTPICWLSSVDLVSP